MNNLRVQYYGAPPSKDTERIQTRIAEAVAEAITSGEESLGKRMTYTGEEVVTISCSAALAVIFGRLTAAMGAERIPDEAETRELFKATFGACYSFAQRTRSEGQG